MAFYLLLSISILEISVLSVAVRTPLKCNLGTKPCKDGSECILYQHVCDGEVDCRDGSDEEDCTVTCTKGQFLCAHGKKCIDQRQVCDGVAQCQDRSDEVDCLEHMEGCAHHCDKTRCLPDTFLCDGEKDCLDGTDEADCDSDSDGHKNHHDEVSENDSSNYKGITTMSAPAPLKCPFGTKPCQDKTACVLYSHVCDGDADCKDGSDEETCSLECDNGQFQCAHGKKCIDQRQVCDGVAQCQDRSDEIHCLKPMEGCAHHCDNKTRCLPDTFLCDGERDCLDGTDEANCADESCSSGEFRCTSGQCVSISMRCDGHPDCWDHSDEESCHKPPQCTTNRRCPQSQECLLEEWVCDGEQDCKDGSDEENCEMVQLKCGEFQWACTSKSQCVPKAWRCDGTKDCADESDEAGCGQVATCPSHQFQCASTSECLDMALVCNSVRNCADGSDEGGDCKTTCPDKAICVQNCYSTPQGTRCGCKAGYQLNEDAVSCGDIDECVGGRQGVCSHSCVNTQGSFHCHCNPGYLLESDGRHCKIMGEPYLLASVQTDLFLVGLRSSSLYVLVSSAKKAILSVDYDWRDQRVFWVSLDSESIKWSSLDQKKQGTLFKGIKSDCIAVDWIGRNMYWIDGIGGGRIIAIGLNSTITSALDLTVILDKEFGQLLYLALLPQKGLLFWSEISNEAKIERAGMDGSERRVVVSHSLSWPGSLAVDPIGERLYWTDKKLGCIGSATLDGGDVKILQLLETTNPFSVTVFNDLLYWSDTKRGTIQGANKITGKNCKVLLKRPAQAFGLKVIHPLLQTSTDSPCEKLHCSHLCVLAPGPKGVCKCPSGLLLAEDGLNCSNLVNSAFLLVLSPTVVTQIYLQTMLSAVGLKTWPEHLSLPLANVNEAAILDYTLRDKMLYLADSGHSSVGLFKLKETSLVPRGQFLQLKGDTVTALALDWITLNVYWSSTKQSRLQVTSSNGEHTAVLIDDIGSLESIALHPLSGRLCFAKQGESAHVECAHMDGGKRAQVWKDAVQPTSLTFSNDGGEIYWADIGAGVIGSVRVDGSGYIAFTTGDGLIAFALSNSMLLWVTDRDTTQVWYRDDQLIKTLWFEVNTEVVSLKAYSKSSQMGFNFCSDGNGDCSHFCLAVPGGRTCRCAHGHRPVNATHCALDQHCPAGSRPCLDGHTCLPLEKFCDGHPECLDTSDENCVHLKGQSEVQSKAPTLPPSPSIPTSADLGSTTSLDNSGLVRNLDVKQQCSEKRCNGNGECVETNGGTSCACGQGYSGDSCQDQLANTMQGPLIYGAVGLCAAIVVISVLVAVVRRKTANARRASPVVKQTSMTDLAKHGDSPSTQHSPDDTNFSEEVASSVA
ncbi:low-density lipoprotein receptor-related protein 4 isoform X2 [Oncorhynchus kisutch]|uniref:low-density lipoprotein receptor-related protein 4 isoform X2 n=1 Tax=Oncorhynchus kisutch TaxID=8019 RepID=UPI0012DD46C0|nr:low-density lipoprotein receptor-related protein 4 isoform X2 [Oncorhynchus kisutch]